MTRSILFILFVFMCAACGSADAGFYSEPADCGGYSLTELGAGNISCSAPSSCAFDGAKRHVANGSDMRFICNCNIQVGGSWAYSCIPYNDGADELIDCRVDPSPSTPMAEVCGPDRVVLSCTKPRHSVDGCLADFWSSHDNSTGLDYATSWCC